MYLLPFSHFPQCISPYLIRAVKQVLVNKIIRKEWVPKECYPLVSREKYCGINQNRTGKVTVFCGKIGKIMGKNNMQKKGKGESKLIWFSQRCLFYRKTAKGKSREIKKKFKNTIGGLMGKWRKGIKKQGRGRTHDANLFPRVKYIPLTAWLGFCFCFLPPSASLKQIAHQAPGCLDYLMSFELPSYYAVSLTKILQLQTFSGPSCVVKSMEKRDNLR